jgi:multidrug efflux pump subunit AcrB
VAFAVLVSLFVAFTLTPMLASKFITHGFYFYILFILLSSWLAAKARADS